MRVQFVASFSPIVADPTASREFYADALGLSFEGREGDYAFTHELGGVKHFGMWPLRVQKMTTCALWRTRSPLGGS